jgi:hypothetical protein
VARRDALALAVAIALVQQNMWWVLDGSRCQWLPACATQLAAATSHSWCNTCGCLDLVHESQDACGMCSSCAMKSTAASLVLCPHLLLRLLQGCTSSGAGSSRGSRCGGGV